MIRHTAHSSRVSGFTMIELLITVAIFTVLVGVVLANYRSFTSNTDLVNAGESLVLSIREAQIYGIGSRGGDSLAICNDFSCVYGVYVEKGASSFRLFSEDGELGNQIFNSSPDETIRVVPFPSGVSVADIFCDSSPCDNVSITFKRPDPSATIKNSSGEEYSEAVITVTNANEKSAHVTVTKAGQLSVESE